jgi:geranylgeranyl pyrophosphate synthase
LNRKPTLPMILYLRNVGVTERTATLDRINHNGFDESAAQEVVYRFCESGAVASAKREAERLIEEAIVCVSDFSNDSQAVAALVSIARFVVNRNS